MGPSEYRDLATNETSATAGPEPEPGAPPAKPSTDEARASQADPPSTASSALVTWRELLFVLTIVVTFLVDQWTKRLARQYLYEEGPRSISVIGDVLKLTYVENRGAAFGLLQNQTLFFIIVGLVVIGVIIASYSQMGRPSVFLTLCLGLQMGGAIGNLVDRMREGYVVDFLELPYWPVFNIADSAIVVGVGGLVYTMLFPGSRRGADER